MLPPLIHESDFLNIKPGLVFAEFIQDDQRPLYLRAAVLANGGTVHGAIQLTGEQEYRGRWFGEDAFHGNDLIIYPEARIIPDVNYLAWRSSSLQSASPGNIALVGNQLLMRVTAGARDGSVFFDLSTGYRYTAQVQRYVFTPHWRIVTPTGVGDDLEVLHTNPAPKLAGK